MVLQWIRLLFVAVALFLIHPMFARSKWIKGRLGESKVNVGLGLLLNRRVYRAFNNITLPIANGTTQIDQVLISTYGVFVVETKNMKGWIFGHPLQAQWVQIIYRRKERFQNPLRQNYKHLRAIQELLGLESHQVFNVVVFVGACTLKTQMPPEVVKGFFALSKFIKSKRVPVFADNELPGLIQMLSDRRLRPGLRTNFSHVRNANRQFARRADPNLCPRCGSELVERTNRHSGEKFSGCSRYPQCKGTRTQFPQSD